MRTYSQLALLLLLLSFVGIFQAEAATCGTERWAVKTGTDPDAKPVDLSVVHRTRVAAMRSWQAPNHLPTKSRIAPYETQVWSVDATLKAFKQETDSDYHLVLADKSGNTIIAEIPLPECVSEASPFADEIAAARKKFDERFQVTGGVPVPVATALRASLIEVAQARSALVGKSNKMGLVYNYLSGPEFRQRVEAIV